MTVERKEAPYYVWRRGDGYVGCTRHKVRSVPTLGAMDQFTTLLVTDDWSEARALIEQERNKHFDSGVEKVVLHKPYCRTCGWLGVVQEKEDDALQLLAWHRKEDHERT